MDKFKKFVKECVHNNATSATIAEDLVPEYSAQDRSVDCTQFGTIDGKWLSKVLDQLFLKDAGKIHKGEPALGELGVPGLGKIMLIVTKGPKFKLKLYFPPNNEKEAKLYWEKVKNMRPIVPAAPEPPELKLDFAPKSPSADPLPELELALAPGPHISLGSPQIPQEEPSLDLNAGLSLSGFGGIGEIALPSEGPVPQPLSLDPGAFSLNSLNSESERGASDILIDTPPLKISSVPDVAPGLPEASASLEAFSLDFSGEIGSVPDLAFSPPVAPVIAPAVAEPKVSPIPALELNRAATSGFALEGMDTRGPVVAPAAAAQVAPVASAASAASAASDRALSSLLGRYANQNVDAVIFASDTVPKLKLANAIQATAEPKTSGSDLDEWVSQKIPAAKRTYFDRRGDCAFLVRGREKNWRAILNRTTSGQTLICEPLSAKTPSLVGLQLPGHSAALCKSSTAGLVLLSAPTAARLTDLTTAFVHGVAMTPNRHIAEITEVVAYTAPSTQSVLSQREVGAHTDSEMAGFLQALQEGAGTLIVTSTMPRRPLLRLLFAAAATGRLIFFGTIAPGLAQSLQQIHAILGAGVEWRRGISCLQAVIHADFRPGPQGAVEPAHSSLFASPELAALLCTFE